MTPEKRLEEWNASNGSPFDAPDLAGLAEYIREGAPKTGPDGSYSGPSTLSEAREGIAETFPDLSPGQAESLARFVSVEGAREAAKAALDSDLGEAETRDLVDVFFAAVEADRRARVRSELER